MADDKIVGALVCAYLKEKNVKVAEQVEKALKVVSNSLRKNITM